MTKDEILAYFDDVFARITEGPAAYCNPEVGWADALFLYSQLNEANRAVLALDRMVNGG